MSALQVLRDARALLTEETWWSHSDPNRPGTLNESHCIATGLYAVTRENRDARNAARALLAKEIGAMSLSAWNDAPGRTLQDVHAAFDRAIAAEEARGG